MICNNYLFEEDLLNENGSRNEKNTKKDLYNCGGYALGIFNWYCPHDEDDIDNFFGPFPRADMTVEEKLEFTLNYMLSEFKDLRVIKGIEELEQDEYAIAYKIGYHDFHFAKRLDDGTWLHKPGGLGIRKMEKEELMSDVWVSGSTQYDSRTVFLAKKKLQKYVTESK